jgi:hypothetical protein
VSAVNLIIAASGATEDRIRAAREAAGSVAGAAVDERTDGAAWLGWSGDGAVSTVEAPGWTAAAYGSGVRTLDPGTRALQGPDDLLDGADDDLVAVGAAAGRVTVATGRGNHRLFRTDLPEGGTIVSSHLGVLARACGPDLAVDRGMEDFLLGFGFLPDGATPYAGIHAVAPGTRATLGDDREQRPVVAPAHEAKPEASDFDSAVEELHRRLVGIVEEQAGDDTRHAVLLGGFDSALVAAMLRQLGHEVHTYTFGFGDPRFEQARAEELARQIGAEHTWVQMTPESVFAGIRQFADVFPQPGPQPHYQVHTLRASQVMRDHGHRHVFSGDGCDAVFLGYPMVNTRARIVASLDRVPPGVVRAGIRAMSTGVADRHLGHVARMARSTLGNLLLPWPARGHLPTRYLDNHALSRLRRQPPPAQREPVDHIRMRLADAVVDLDRTRLAFHGSGLTGQSRAKVDGAVTATGVVQRSPFLHPSLKSFVGSLPTEYLRPPGSSAGSAGKALLTEMARRHRLVPDAIIDMPKQSPVDSPIDEWYAGTLRGEVLELLGHLPFDFDRGYVDEMLRHKRAEDLFRDRVSLGHHALQAVGLLCSYASFAELAGA